MAKVFIGVGHGGADSGAVANGLKEKDLNLNIALACRDELERHGVTVLMSRTKDENEGLTEKINECNAFKPDYALDIHNNAGGGDGAEIFHHYKGGKGKTLAENILNAVVKIGQNSRGAKTKTNSAGKDYYGFIRQTSAPAIIFEGAFLDNKNDIAIIDTVEEQKVMGVAIAKGILTTLGMAYIEPKPTASGKLYRVQVGAYSVKENAEKMQKRLQAAGFDAIIV
jgi:N-acetylmuramoyl-L-alanine amidase